MHKQNLALNNQQGLICHKLQPTYQYTYMHAYIHICVCVYMNMYRCMHSHMYIYVCDVCGVMITILGNGHNDPSSNPGQGCIDFT